MTSLDLDQLVLKHGSHRPPSGGKPPTDTPDMCVMEAVAYVAGEPWSDHPKCASRVLTSFLIGLNDRWSDGDRQLLKPFIPRLVGTNTGPNDEETRRWMIVDWLVHEYAPAMFRHVGLTAEAEEFEGMVAITSNADWQTARTRIRAVRDEQWARRRAAIDRIHAAADAAAVAAADAAAVAAADADAAAAADADAVAVAVAVAAADAAPAADAAAAAVADADAVGFKAKVQEATAVAVAARKRGDSAYSAAYRVLRPYYDERYRGVFESAGIRESVLGLIDRLIEVGKS